MRRLTAACVVEGGDAGPVAEAPTVPMRAIARRFWPYARPYRRWLVLTGVFIVLDAAIETAAVWLFKILVDDVLVPRDLHALVWVGALFVAVTLGGGLVGFADDVLSTWVSERFLLDLRTRFYAHLQRLPLDFFEGRRLGDVLSRLTGDIQAIESFVLSGVADALSYGLRVVFFAGALFFLQWDLALVALVVAPIFYVAARRTAALLKRASREKRRRSGSIGAVAEEGLANMALVQAYGREETERDRFHAQNLGAFRAQMTATRLRAGFGPLVELIELVGVLLVMAYGTVKLSRGDLSLGGLLVFMAYLSKVFSPVRGLSRLTTGLFSASASAERVIEFMEERPAVTDPAAPLPAGRRRGEVRFDDVRFTYPGAADSALRGVDLEVGPGEVLALVGPSGAGKSTVARLLLRFADPSAGRLLLDGADARAYALDDLRANVAVVLQETLVFDATVFENIAYGRAGATRAEVEAAARAADAHDFIVGLPDGYDSRVGQRGRRLSGGQRQRIAIARALVTDPRILVLDDATSSVDASTEQAIKLALREAMRGRTTFVIAHRLSTIALADDIVVLEEGQVAARGPHEQLLRESELYAEIAAKGLPDQVFLNRDPIERVAGL
jgi:ABC-type multidrug transport system fused ATPase/permease subunit